MIERPEVLIAERWPMVGGGTAYEIRVPRRLAPRATVVSHVEGQQFVSLTDATLPADHHDMPRGVERYEAYIAHQREARAAQLDIAREVFPELERVDSWPLLWVPAWTLGRERWVWVPEHGWTKTP